MPRDNGHNMRENVTEALKHTKEFYKMYANACAMIEVLADNRMMALDMLRFLTPDIRRRLQESMMRLLHWIDEVDSE